MDNIQPSVPSLPATSELVKKQVASDALKGQQFTLLKNREDHNDIAIIKGLGADEYIKEIWLQANGYEFNYLLSRWEKKSTPIMNEEGIRNLMMVLNLALRMDFSNMDENDIPKLTIEFHKTNFAQFVIYQKEFNLHSKDFNIINIACWIPFYIAARNAKGAGHRNAVRGVLSEDILAKMAQPDKTGGFWDKIFGRKKT